MDSCATHLKDEIGLYDIHTYPSKITVNSGEYTDIIRAYKQAVPAGRKIVMGEIGFKFVEPADLFISVKTFVGQRQSLMLRWMILKCLFMISCMVPTWQMLFSRQ